MVTDTVSLKGSLLVNLYDEHGALKDQRDIKNLVVTTGKNLLASRLTANTTPVMSHMAVGTSNTAPVVGNTALGSEIGRVALDSTTAVNAVVTYIATFLPGTGTGTLTEAGIFNAGAAGTMLCRANFNAVNKAAGDTIVITWNVTVL